MNDRKVTMESPPGPDSARWERVRQLFEAARVFPLDEQIPYLKTECGSDQGLFEDVLALLAAERNTGAFSKTESIPPFAPHQIIAERFRILRRLGAGGMGEVYEAEDLRLDEHVALKTILREIASDPNAIERFKREILLAKRVTHPHICRIHDLGVHRAAHGPEMLFLTMTFLDGETLASRIRRGPMSQSEALPLIADMSDALSAAHEAGVIHRDFKSSNVILVQGKDRAQAVVTDFGLAIVRESRNLEESLTKIVGTIAYMAPEQIQGERIDAAADIYALGVVMYEMLTGRCPFLGDSAVSIALKHLSEKPTPPRAFAPDLDARFEQTVLRCLKKKPEERFASAAEVKAALHDASPRRYSVKAHRRGMLAAAAVAILGITMLVLLVIGAHSWLRWPWNGLPLERRVAVLPFQNIGGDAKEAAFSQGLMEAFTNKLTDLEQFQNSLSVVPASDVRKENVASAREARREFGANLVITGSVERAEDGVHLIVNLVDADKLKQLRSRAIFIPQSDVIAMQDGVIKQVADLLDVALGPEARQHLAEGNTTVPGAYDFYLQGSGYLAERDGTDQAIEEFQHALDLDPDYALAHAGLAQCYWRKYSATKDHDWITRAWSEAKKAVKSNPNIAATHITLATLNAGTGEYAEAIRQARRAVEIDPANYQAFTELANALDATGHTQEAETALKNAIALKPSYWRTYIELGSFYFTHSRYKDAETAFRRVIELVPDNPTGYTDLGAIYHLENRDRDAEQVLQKSIQIRPTTLAYSNLAIVYFFEGRHADLIPIMEKLVEADKKNYVLWGNLADAYRWAPGQRYKAAQAYRTAIDLAEDALRVNPKDSQGWSSLALYEAKLGQSSKAITALDQALTTTPNDSNVLFKAAVVYELAGKRESALKYLETAFRAGYSVNEINAEPELSNLRSDPRYNALIATREQNGRK